MGFPKDPFWLPSFFLYFHCYADDTQVYLPIKRNSDGLDALLACLVDVKALLLLNFLNFNEEQN